MSFLVTCIKFVSILLGLVTYIIYASMYFRHDYDFSWREDVKYNQLIISLFFLCVSTLCYLVAAIILVCKLIRKRRGCKNAVTLILITIMITGLVSIIFLLFEVIYCVDSAIVSLKCAYILYNGILTFIVILIGLFQVFAVPMYFLSFTGFIKSIQICKC
jgi:hypothetical protein